MKILSIGGSYKPANGGNAKRISTMCEAFLRAGHEVVVMTCASYNVADNNEIINGVRVLRYSDCDSLAKSVSETAKEKNIDIILIHEETYLRKLRFLGVNIPVVYECHAIEPNPNKYKELLCNVIRKLYFNTGFIKRVFVLSKNAADNFSQKYGYPKDSIVYTPNGLDKENVYTDIMHFGEGESFIYGYSGTLYEFQGIKVLLKYAKDILAIAPDVKLMIVGGGPMESEVRSFVSENGLEDRIIVTGSVSQEQFDELTQKFDVMLMPRPSTPSTESAVPLKIFDAAIHKKPVVMSNVSGLTEAFSEKAALIYDTKSPDEFIECCNKIYRNRELAENLVAGEEEALRLWPTVDDVASYQLESMKKVIRN